MLHIIYTSRTSSRSREPVRPPPTDMARVCGQPRVGGEIRRPAISRLQPGADAARRNLDLRGRCERGQLRFKWGSGGADACTRASRCRSQGQRIGLHSQRGTSRVTRGDAFRIRMRPVGRLQKPRDARRLADDGGQIREEQPHDLMARTHHWHQEVSCGHITSNLDHIRATCRG